MHASAPARLGEFSKRENQQLLYFPVNIIGEQSCNYCHLGVDFLFAGKPEWSLERPDKAACTPF
jgi:hypothetical protein